MTRGAATGAKLGLLAMALMGLSGCIEQGTGGGPVTGAAGGATSVGAASNIERCSETLGTLAVDDGREQAWWGPFAQRTQITTIEPMVRLVVQQSNCFVITAMGNSRLEGRMRGMIDDMRNSGEFRAGSRMQRGQRVAADYFLEPAILFSNVNTGGLGGGIGGWAGLAIGAAGAALSQSSTSVTMSLFDMRSGVQVAASEGSSTATNAGAILAGFGAGAGGALGGYQRTPAGQATVAAFVNAYNKLVVAARGYRAQEVRGGLGTGGRLQVR
ncbi:hypothetical protein [Roseicella aquatilis]|uniref:Peptidoglycan-binding protein n=1 Tax=Roseicella aquatilis TaxID=2527868 RepID=A0A4R4DAZ4_9PROT|nr:hypothetical protein [Roseicella aquatilis]TCZ57174.1 hypothetical protein EXY23_18715 [Roseicella aquatilis]